MADEIKSTITDDELKNLKKQMLDSITNEKLQLVINYPFIGDIALRLQYVPVRDKRLDTAATDGSKIYFDMNFYSNLSEAERCFVIAHEVWHCVMMHFLRKQTRDAYLFNIATDMEINYIIRQSSEDSMFHPPEGSLFPPTQLQSCSAEDIYEFLLSNHKQEKLKSSHHNGKLDGQFDRHTYSNDDNLSNDELHQSYQDRWGEKGYDSDYQPNIENGVSEKIREAVISAAQKEIRNKGKLPSSIQSLVKEYQEAEISWQEHLAQFVTTVFGGKRHWLPPSRRHIYNEIYLQSRRDERLNAVVAIDTSGSCYNSIPKFMGELISLLDTFGQYEVTVIYCDADVQKVDVYTENNKYEIEDGLTWAGGGGTSFCPPFNYVSEHGMNPGCFIYLTDGFGNAPKTNPGYPVLWVLTSNGNNNFCSWGKKIRFKSSKYENA